MSFTLNPFHRQVLFVDAAVSGAVHPTMLGYAFVIAQALAVALLAELQFIGLRRVTATA